MIVVGNHHRGARGIEGLADLRVLGVCLRFASTLGLHMACGVGQRMGQRTWCVGGGVSMCTKIGAGGDVARQRGQPAGTVAECFGLLAEPQCDLAKEQGQAGQHRGLQQRRPQRSTVQQRCQQGERTDATGQPHRKAITVAQQYAQQQGNRQCR